MTHDQLKQVGDAWAAALAKDIDEVIERIDSQCEVRRWYEDHNASIAFCVTEHSSRQAGTLGLLSDAGVRQRLVAAGIIA